MTRKFIQRNDGLKFPKSRERNRHPDLEYPNDIKLDESNKIHAETHNQIVESQRQKEFWKQQKKNDFYHVKGSIHKTISRYSSRNLAGKRKWDDIFKALKEKRTAKQEYYIQQNSPSNMNER